MKANMYITSMVSTRTRFRLLLREILFCHNLFSTIIGGAECLNLFCTEKTFKLHIVTEFKVTIISVFVFRISYWGGVWGLLTKETFAGVTMCSFHPDRGKVRMPCSKS